MTLYGSLRIFLFLVFEISFSLNAYWSIFSKLCFSTFYIFVDLPFKTLLLNMNTLTPYETFLFSNAFRRDAIAEVVRVSFLVFLFLLLTLQMVEGTRDIFFDDKDIELVLHVLRELRVAMEDLKFMKKSLYLYHTSNDDFHTISKRIYLTSVWNIVSSSMFLDNPIRRFSTWFSILSRARCLYIHRINLVSHGPRWFSISDHCIVRNY